MSSLYKEQFCTEVFIAVLLVYLAKTLQYVLLMVVFIFLYTSGGIWNRWVFSKTQINKVNLHHYSYPTFIVYCVSFNFSEFRVLSQFCQV